MHIRGSRPRKRNVQELLIKHTLNLHYSSTTALGSGVPDRKTDQGSSYVMHGLHDVYLLCVWCSSAVVTGKNGVGNGQTGWVVILGLWDCGWFVVCENVAD